MSALPFPFWRLPRADRHRERRPGTRPPAATVIVSHGPLWEIRTPAPAMKEPAAPAVLTVFTPVRPILPDLTPPKPTALPSPNVCPVCWTRHGRCLTTGACICHDPSLLRFTMQV